MENLQIGDEIFFDSVKHSERFFAKVISTEFDIHINAQICYLSNGNKISRTLNKILRPKDLYICCNNNNIEKVFLV